MKNKTRPEKSFRILGLIAVIILASISLYLFALLVSQPMKQGTVATLNPLSVTVDSPVSSAENDPIVQLAWFTTIPRTEDLLTVAQRFDLYIIIQGNEDERDLMIELGAKGPFLQYLDSQSIQDPGSCVEDPQVNQVTFLAGDFCEINEQHPNWFLLDQNGERILLMDGDSAWYLMDPGNAEWRAFYLNRIKQSQAADPNYSGVFLDNVPITLAFLEEDGRIPAAYPDDTSYQAAVQEFLKYLYENYFQPNDKLLYANISSRKDDSDWTRHLTYLDGVMLEGWAIDWPNRYRPVERWEQHMALAEQTQEMGKPIILVSRGYKDDLELQQFAFASYLLINNGQAMFRYAHGSKYREVWLYENYSYKLGQPLGPRYKDGNAWRRDFTNGSVMVNPQTHATEIIVGK